ncbi:hypothetical protein BQ8420_03585 [Nocardiopsis sp. JB363]|nr:hypothetical protein BQ8420_03585 [Nocardiopsis sp. JB363]
MIGLFHRGAPYGSGAPALARVFGRWRFPGGRVLDGPRAGGVTRRLSLNVTKV